MTRKFAIAKATRERIRTRLSISGPSGSGKTTAALEAATRLIADEPDGRILVIDTERNSASLYADRFDFDAVDFTPPYNPADLTELLGEVGSAGSHPVVVIDSLSHFWAGQGGVLEQVDTWTQQSSAKNSYTNGWSKGTPLQNQMVEAILNYPGHVIVCLRSKTEYILAGPNGKTPTKVGMAAVQRDGVEYEFTLSIDLDRSHGFTIPKSRCTVLDDPARMYAAGELLAVVDTFIEWIGQGGEQRIGVLDAKRRLFSAYTSAGLSKDAAKEQASAAWAAANLDGEERVALSTVEDLCRAAAAAVAAAQRKAADEGDEWGDGAQHDTGTTDETTGEAA